jgi:signal transduction histidine kinase
VLGDLENDARALVAQCNPDRVGFALDRVAEGGLHEPEQRSLVLGAEARELITQTIKELRAVAVDLSPKALEDYGLATALATLAKAFSARMQIDVHVDGDWDARLRTEDERALFRLVQAVLGNAIKREADSIGIALRDEGARVVLEITEHGGVRPTELPEPPEPTTSHLRALGARLSLRRSQTGLVLRAELPASGPVR